MEKLQRLFRFLNANINQLNSLLKCNFSAKYIIRNPLNITTHFLRFFKTNRINNKREKKIKQFNDIIYIKN